MDEDFFEEAVFDDAGLDEHAGSGSEGDAYDPYFEDSLKTTTTKKKRSHVPD